MSVPAGEEAKTSVVLICWMALLTVHTQVQYSLLQIFPV